MALAGGVRNTLGASRRSLRGSFALGIVVISLLHERAALIYAIDLYRPASSIAAAR